MSSQKSFYTAPSSTRSRLRDRITSHYRMAESDLVAQLMRDDVNTLDDVSEIQTMARDLASNLRIHAQHASGRVNRVQALLQEFSLSSQEGIALMCLAEALLRIPDQATRDALIIDKIQEGDWSAHLGKSDSLFVNAASWGLLITGKLLVKPDESGLSASMRRLVNVGGEPLIRRGMDIAMRMMGEQFVAGETILQGLNHVQTRVDQNFRYSYDMLGESALTMEDAKRYTQAYENAIHTIGKLAAGKGVYQSAGISIKLSALHPRYVRTQKQRVMSELYPTLLALAQLASHYDIGLNIDAEEAERLDLSLDLMTALCDEPSLAQWQGLGFVVQAYQKRCSAVIDFLQELAKSSGHRLMIRLVKGAYWDSEIKRAQVDGLEDYPVFTRKAHTDLNYLHCARQLLAHPAAFYPQFATHNAHTVAAIVHFAGADYQDQQYEFQCLYGMGEALYEQLAKMLGTMACPCRIYAPIGSYETLLAYLVRRLLENGANTSFVNRMADAQVSLETLLKSPQEQVRCDAKRSKKIGASHPAIPLPVALFQHATQNQNARLNSLGRDLSNENQLKALAQLVDANQESQWHVRPLISGSLDFAESSLEKNVVHNPARHREVVGTVCYASQVEVSRAYESATKSTWSQWSAIERAQCLDRAAFLLQDDAQIFTLLIREAGKTYANAISEIREAVDFLRFYAEQARALPSQVEALGTVVCISPWNFPLAIFLGQVVAALAAGNTVLAKPAEQTPLVAASAIELLYRVGIPRDAVQFLPGLGHTVGAQLVADSRVCGVMFTGSIEVARILQKQLSGRVNAKKQTIVLIAETGGQNAMIVDSSALLEQVVTDVMASAFDSAGQRCSALRVLCVQDDIADRLCEMLLGAMRQLMIDNPLALSTDVGPLIDQEAMMKVQAHLEFMRTKGHQVRQAGQHDSEVLAGGHFVLPAVIEIADLTELRNEIFGPVLHVLRFSREKLPSILSKINQLGYGLTLGVHTRINHLIEQVSNQAQVGNVYVNRNMVGAVVGVQPFGGEGLSGTGPKAGGPFYLYRLLNTYSIDAALLAAKDMVAKDMVAKDMVAKDMVAKNMGEEVVRYQEQKRAQQHLNILSVYAQQREFLSSVKACAKFAQSIPSWRVLVLPGPTGERNLYQWLARSEIACFSADHDSLLVQLAAVITVGGHALWVREADKWRLDLPLDLQSYVTCVDDSLSSDGIETARVVLHHGDESITKTLSCAVAEIDRLIIPVHSFAEGETCIELEKLMLERVHSVNTSASGGNAALMMMDAD